MCCEEDLQCMTTIRAALVIAAYGRVRQRMAKKLGALNKCRVTPNKTGWTQHCIWQSDGRRRKRCNLEQRKSNIPSDNSPKSGPDRPKHDAYGICHEIRSRFCDTIEWLEASKCSFTEVSATGCQCHRAVRRSTSLHQCPERKEPTVMDSV